MTTRATEVRPRGWYNMQDILREQMFPWVSSLGSIRKIVAKDAENRNILKTTVIGTGRGTKYHIKGVNIIKFVKAVEDGKIIP